MNSGYILIDKPIDWTSFDVVKKVRKILRAKKVGHTGTLDPFATGLLLLLVNDATKLCQSLTNLDKVYLVTGRFGYATDTGDRTGKPLNDDTDIMVTKEQFIQKIPVILSIDSQTPPKFSAIKISGKKAYELARKQVDFSIPDRKISILDFTLIDFDFPFFTYQVHVSKGTYVRTLTEQIANLFDTKATTTELKRLQIGDFHLKDATRIEEICEDSIKPLVVDSEIADSRQNAVESENLNCLDAPLSATSYQPPATSSPSPVAPPTHLQPATCNLKPQSPVAPPTPSSLCTMHYALCTDPRPVITIGSFDGLHLGHQFVLKETLRIANELSAPAIVITFTIHPKIFINAHNKPFLLIDTQKRNEYIKEIGIHQIENLKFDSHLATMPAIDFLKYIVDTYHPRMIVTGYDTHFGANRSGNTDFLFAHANEFGFQVHKLSPFLVEGTIPSSSLIRYLITSGNVSTAHKYLGRPFSLSGKVVTGQKIGSTIGFPTMNICLNDPFLLIPATGVYFTFTIIDGKKYYSATNIGICPTLKSENQISIETHLLDYNGSAYDYIIEIFFMQQIRLEKKCKNAQALIDTIQSDIKKIRSMMPT